MEPLPQGLERQNDLQLSHNSAPTYGYARHLGTIERPAYILPRIQIPYENEDGDATTLSPISFRIPRIFIGERSTDYVSRRETVNLPPTPPEFNYPEDVQLKKVELPQGAVMADAQLIAPENAALVKNFEERALNNNTALSFQTILFSMLRYPALICVFIGASSLWGRGMDVTKVSYEWSMSLASVATGCALLLLSLLLLSDSRNSYMRATVLAWLRQGYVLLGVGGSIVVIVFAALTIPALENVQSSDCQSCLSSSERLVQLAVMIGASSLILMLSLFALVVGCIGVYQMKGLLAMERATVAAAPSAEFAVYSNEDALQF